MNKAEEAGWPVVRYVSLFAGVEAFSVAASRIAGAKWEPVFFSEIDPFPCAVLAHRFPGVQNLGDVCKIKVREAEDGRKEITNGTASIPFPDGGIDILAGGSPCQDFSLAGLRKGLAGERSGLAIEYLRLVEQLRPRILLWENVPGVLSSNGGRDFAAIVRRMVELGFGIAWRVLDVQWTRTYGPMPGGVWGGFPRAIPQRRERVWIVGLAGADARRAGEILFEPYRDCRNPTPRREAGKGFASPPGYCAPLAAQARGEGFGETGRGYWQPGIQCLRAEGENRPSRPGNVVAMACGSDRDGAVGGAWSIGNGQLNSTAPETACKTLDAMNDPQKVVIRASASFDGTDCAPTLHRPNGSPGQSDQEIFSQGGGIPRPDADRRS